MRIKITMPRFVHGNIIGYSNASYDALQDKMSEAIQASDKVNEVSRVIADPFDIVSRDTKGFICVVAWKRCTYDGKCSVTDRGWVTCKVTYEKKN